MLNKTEINDNIKIIKNRLLNYNLTKLTPESDTVLRVSETYNGIWLEHAYDAVIFADLFPEKSFVSLNQIDLFLQFQLEDGHIPYSVRSDGQNLLPRYSQLQECVSFAQICLMAIKQNKCSREKTEKIYYSLCKWNSWYEKKRMNKDGLILTFCGFDTGHDQSSRLNRYGKKYVHSFEPTGCVMPKDSDVLPVISPDINAVVYGNRTTLAEMAKMLGKTDEYAFFSKKARSIKNALFTKCYDKKSDFFYDVDKNGDFIPIKSISVTSLFVHKLFDIKTGRKFFKKYFKNKSFFGTEYPYPSVAVSDKEFKKNSEGNSWNYFSQGLTALRSVLWMDHYGLHKELCKNMKKWLYALTVNKDTKFSQELDPFTGKPSRSSEYYSSTMLFYLLCANAVSG